MRMLYTRKDWLAFLGWSMVFGIAYTQAPLYYSNQNQYFLHGLAQAGWGQLDRDWLANTLDPVPVFSAFVTLTWQGLHDYVFHGVYLLMLGFYFHNLAAMFVLVTQQKDNPRAQLLFNTLLVVLHAGLIRLASAQLTGVDYPWYFQAGLAGQYTLGFGLQPSVAGVFLIASIVAYLRGQSWLAIVWACLAGVVHGTYLLGAAMLVLSYLYLHCRDGRVKDALLLGLAALALVLPMVIRHLVTFAPTSRDAFTEAQRILAHVRIPHHAEVARWCDGIALAQVAWIVLGIILARGSKLFTILLTVFTLSTALTFVQLASDSDTLALLFPWRTSAILVPIASAIVLVRVVTLVGPYLTDGRSLALRIACGCVLAALTLGGVLIYVFEWGYRSNPTELPLLEFIKANRQPGDVYLLPVEIPKTGSGAKGASSTNFTPAPRAGKSGHLIAIDLQRFRLFTGAPIYVDFKSIPYKDVEVLEWHRRLLWAHSMYSQRDWIGPDAARSLADEGITHVVAAKDRDVRCDALELVYEDGSYRLYRRANPPKNR